MATQAIKTITTERHEVEAEPHRFVFGSMDKFFTLTLDMFFIAGLTAISSK
jgi:hypothetical protein